METNGKTESLVIRAERAESALETINMPEARAELDVLSATVVRYDHANNEAAKAETASQAQAAYTAAAANLEDVLQVVPFAVEELDPEHAAKLPKAADYVHIGRPYYARDLIPVLEQGGKGSQVMARLVERALAQSDKAQAHVEASAQHDAKAKDKSVAARKELIAAVNKAEAFVHLNTPAGHEARQQIKRPRGPNKADRKDKGKPRGSSGDGAAGATQPTPAPAPSQVAVNS